MQYRHGAHDTRLIGEEEMIIGTQVGDRIEFGGGGDGTNRGGG